MPKPHFGQIVAGALAVDNESDGITGTLEGDLTRGTVTSADETSWERDGDVVWRRAALRRLDDRVRGSPTSAEACTGPDEGTDDEGDSGRERLGDESSSLVVRRRLGDLPRATRSSTR
mmetsp:Transcript_1017/g.3107  ORF Transcript_1017/g.3107 Transcript_1017/m.3107 type:complete len:118 (+) Transcript_1017:398-751(+)